MEITMINNKVDVVPQKRVWRWYLVLSIVFHSLSILSGIYFLVPKLILPVLLVFGPLTTVWFLFEIVIFVLMLINKIERVALLLPSISVIDLFFSSSLGIIASISIGTEAMLLSPLVLGLSLIFPIVNLILAIHLISRK